MNTLSCEPTTPLRREDTSRSVAIQHLLRSTSLTANSRSLLPVNLGLSSVGRSLRRAPHSRIGALGEVALPTGPGSSSVCSSERNSRRPMNGTRWLDAIRLVLAGAALIGTSVAQAQGTVEFSTWIPGKVDAQVTRVNTDLPPVDGRYFAQLYATAPGGTFAPVGKPMPFRSDARRGYIVDGGAVEIPGVSPGGSAQVKVVAWNINLGLEYPEAQSKGQGEVGESAAITVVTGVGKESPAPLVGLQGFIIAPIVPEPGVTLLALLGSLVLFRRQRR
jgi:hypothetical protein